MKKRTFFLVSILLGVIALGFHSVARDQISSGQHLKAVRVAAAEPQKIIYTPDPEAVRLSGNGRTFNTVGLIFTFSCLAFLVVARVRHESGWYSIPFMLLFCDILVQMLL
jgi:hypothetical protein